MLIEYFRETPSFAQVEHIIPSRMRQAGGVLIHSSIANAISRCLFEASKGGLWLLHP
jgi:hypothetical protein